MITYTHDEMFPPDWFSTLTRYNVDVCPKNKVRLYGTCKNNQYYGPREFDITFKIGDLAEYDCYNFQYLGKILDITPKTIVIDASGTGQGKKRLKWHQFAFHNKDFDLEKIRERNHAMSLTI